MSTKWTVGTGRRIFPFYSGTAFEMNLDESTKSPFFTIVCTSQLLQKSYIITID